MPDLTPAERVEIYKQVHRNARPRRDFLIMIALAGGMAGLGLRLNSPAVLIGAMLISPLTSTPTLSPTPGSSPTSTPIPTSTSTPTPTATATPTPVSAFVADTGGRGLRLHWTPAGKLAGVLTEGTRFQLLDEREEAYGLEWVKVRDPDERVGWVAARYLTVAQ